MRALSVLTFSLSVIALADAASAQTAAPDTPAAAAPPKVICVRGQADTGSHFGARKVCHTEAEWAMIHSQSDSLMDRYDTLQNKQMPGAGR